MLCSLQAGSWLRNLSIAGLLIFLASCTGMRRDGPPDFDVDVSRIPNPTPKVEPLAKYGNMSSYRVNGYRYHVLKSPRNFEQTGVASWYGTKFHARRTSSGEMYNMLGMTAAHKTLPLPTYVEVTNLKNHRQIIVKVNDRGPFASNRIIDLSYVAAKKLGMTGRGTALVRIKAINPVTYASNSAPAKPTSNINKAPAVYLQAGAFANRSRAMNFKNRLAKLNYPVRMTLPAANSKLYRVQIGPLRDNVTLDKVSQRLKSMGIMTKKIQEV